MLQMIEYVCTKHVKKTIQNKRQKGTTIATTIRGKSICSDENKEVEEVTCEDEDVYRYVRTVVQALKIGEDEILLGVAWTTKDGYVSHMRFPYVLGTDVTFGDNNKKRPHIRTIGKNARNKNLPFVDLPAVPAALRFLLVFHCGIVEHP